jgi:hypothetical protein
MLPSRDVKGELSHKVVLVGGRTLDKVSKDNSFLKPDHPLNTY